MTGNIPHPLVREATEIVTQCRNNGFPTRQSVWRRGWNDFTTALGSIWFWGVELVIIASLSIYATAIPKSTASDLEKAVVQVVALVVAIVGVLAVTYLVAAAHGLYAQRNEARKKIEDLLDLRIPVLRIDERPLKHDAPGQEGEFDSRVGIDQAHEYLLRVINDSDTDAENCTGTVLEIVPKVRQNLIEAAARGTISHIDLLNLPVPYMTHWPGEGEATYKITMSPGQERSIGVMFTNEREQDRITLAMHAQDKTRLYYQIEETALIFLIQLSSAGALPTYCVFEYDALIPATQGDEFRILYRGAERPNIVDYQSLTEVSTQTLST